MSDNSQSVKKDEDKTVRHSWTFDSHDFGLKLLKNRREKITNAGKYSDRYKDSFSHQVSEDNNLSVYERLRKTSNTDNPEMAEKNLPIEKLKIASRGNSNATNDLNKAHNTLTSYKQFPDGKLLKSPQLGAGLIRKKDKNIYNVTGSDKSSPILPKSKPVALDQILGGNKEMKLSVQGNVSPNLGSKKTVPVSLVLTDKDSTMGHLQQVEWYINRLNKKEKENENLKKFEDLVKKARGPPSRPVAPKVMEKSHDFLKSQEHILNPIKHCNEIEDLQRKDLTFNENESQFKRNTEGRKSLTNESENKIKKNVPLDRTASDAQDRELKIKPRITKTVNRNVAKVFFLFYFS